MPISQDRMMNLIRAADFLLSRFKQMDHQADVLSVEARGAITEIRSFGLNPDHPSWGPIGRLISAAETLSNIINTEVPINHIITIAEERGHFNSRAAANVRARKYQRRKRGLDPNAEPPLRQQRIDSRSPEANPVSPDTYIPPNSSQIEERLRSTGLFDSDGNIIPGKI